MINRINLILTHRCNLNCKHCYMALQSAKQESDEVIRTKTLNIIDMLNSQGIKEIMFTGGEIFTFKYIKEILSYSKSIGMKNIIFTNALDFDYSCIEYIDQVNVSLDGNEESHNRIRGNKKSYQKVIELLDFLKTKDTWTCVQMSVSQDNLHDIDDLSVLLLEYLNVRYVHLNGIISKGNAKKNGISASEDLNKLIIDKLKRLYQETKYHIQFKTSLISQYDFMNNYINEIPRFPVWIDLIDGDFYLIKNNKEFSGSLEGLEIEKIEFMYQRLHDKIKEKQIQKEFINIEEELDSLS